MKQVKKVLDLFLAASPVSSGLSNPNKAKPLSRQDVLALMASNKLSATQAREIMAKRFQQR